MNGRSPLVSVCLPSYNYAPFLPQCIDSVQQQTCSDFELIIIDDASTDESWEIIQACRDPRIRSERHRSRLGAVVTWNRCLELAQGEYVSFLCADDFFLPDKLQCQVDVLLQDTSIGLVHTDGYWVTESGEREGIFSEVFPAGLQDYLADDHVTPAPIELRRLAGGYNYIHLSSAMFRREWALEAGGFSTHFPYAADWDLWLRLAERHTVGYLACPLAIYRRHSQNLTLTMQGSGQEFRDWYGVMNAAFNRWPARAGDLTSVRRQASRVIREHLLACVHKNYAQGCNPAVLRDLWLGFRHDPWLLADRLAIVTYLKALCGGKRTQRSIQRRFARGPAQNGGAS